jgi:hypothetical protein
VDANIGTPLVAITKAKVDQAEVTAGCPRPLL